MNDSPLFVFMDCDFSFFFTNSLTLSETVENEDKILGVTVVGVNKVWVVRIWIDTPASLLLRAQLPWFRVRDTPVSCVFPVLDN